MRAALEEYNKSSFASQDLAATNVVQQSPDKQDSIVNRKRGATIIGTREYLQPILAGTAGEEGTVPSSKDDGYNNIKMRYLRSLNISIAAPTKDIHVSASAPIPIPIPLRKGDSDSDTDSDDDGANDDDDLMPDGQSNDFMIGTPEISHMPVRKDSKSKSKPKFVPPHELLGVNPNGESSLVNHSLPGNHRRKVFGQ